MEHFSVKLTYRHKEGNRLEELIEHLEAQNFGHSEATVNHEEISLMHLSFLLVGSIEKKRVTFKVDR